MILMYTQNRCPACVEAKLFLENNQIPFQEINITNNNKEKLKLIMDYDSQTTPTFIIEDKVIRGYQKEELLSAIKY